MVSQSKPKGRFARIAGIALIVLGIVQITFFVVFLTVIFPANDHCPFPWHSKVPMEGYLTSPDPANPTKMVTIPIEYSTKRDATEREGSTMFMHEESHAINAITRQELPQFAKERTIAVDWGDSLLINTELDEAHRTGHWGPPRGLGEGDSFDLFSGSSPVPVPLSYVDEEDYRGVHVVIMTGEIKNVSLGNDSTTHMPLSMDLMISLKVSPKLGICVYQESLATISLTTPGGKMTVQQVFLRFQEDGIEDNIAKAKSGTKTYTMMSTQVPWGGIVLGVMCIGGGSFLVMKKGKKAAA